jgi:hypothetical protein
MTASLPLALAGFDQPTADLLGELFAGYGLEPRRAGGAGGGAAAATGPATFTMGGSIAVELIRGDMSIASTGTVSYIDGDRVLAFGHPMFQTGETYAPVATSEVLGVVPSALSAFVMAEPLREAGALVQDRQSMILADTRLRHPMIPVDIQLSVGEGKAAEKVEFHVEVWNNRFFTTSLIGAAAASAIGTHLPDRDRVTARIESTLEVRGVPPIKFVDHVYADDGAASLLGGARGLRVLVPLLLNPWSPLALERVELRVDLAFRSEYGDIKEVRLPARELRPGARHELEVVLESFGQPDVVERVPFDVPESLAGQVVTLEVSAGNSARLDTAPVVGLDSLLAAVRKLLPGDVWAVSLYGADEGIARDGIAVADLPASALDRLRPQTTTQRVGGYRAVARTTSPARRVINGSATVTVKIAPLAR